MKLTGMRINQIGFYCQSKEAVDNIKKIFGLQNAVWIKDIMAGVSEVRGRKPGRSIIESQTNSDLGIEIEIINCPEGNMWLDNDMGPVPLAVPVFSHIGIDVDEVFAVGKPWKLIQETFTNEHSRSESELIHFRVYDTICRTYLKFTSKKHSRRKE